MGKISKEESNISKTSNKENKSMNTNRKTLVKITTNWSTLFSDNKSAVKSFVEGGSIRTMVSQLKSSEAKAEAYKLEKYVGASKARIRARKALARTK